MFYFFAFLFLSSVFLTTFFTLFLINL